MQLRTIIKALEVERRKYIKKTGKEPVVFDFESDPFEYEISLTLVNGKRKKSYGTEATSPSEHSYIKWSR